ncbi:hypothetical protein HNP99_003550 [Flavobacterium sp. 28A]|nr:hypothetical protein [Flavobacterium sp. 28A]
MVQKINTGKYQVCKHQIGIGNSIEVLVTGNSQ